MTEPKQIAETVEQVVPGVWRWSVEDERIGGSESDAHAVATPDGRVVLIDPLPLVQDALDDLGDVRAICLTAACHQRSAWRYRRDLGVPVHAPAGARTLEEEPDGSYGDGDELPGGLRAVHAPGPEDAHYAFLAGSVLFCPDLLMRVDGRLEFVPPEHHAEPEQTRETVRGLLELPFTTLCLDHGAPATGDPHAEIRELLGRDE